jgi:methionyl-tRNA formyltransferase
VLRWRSSSKCAAVDAPCDPCDTGGALEVGPAQITLTADNQESLRTRLAAGPLRYAVVTSNRVGYAARFIELAANHPDLSAQLVAVVYCRGLPPSGAARRRLLFRKLRKALAIGVLGTLNGFRMRRWYGREVAAITGLGDVVAVCESAGVRLLEIPHFGDLRGQAQLRALDLDVAVSMGNDYIPSSFFRIPRFGMINVHHELLPEYRGAQTAIWQIYNGSRVSGFTIHEIDKRMDGGRILYREELPLEIRRTLRETVVETTARIQLRSIHALLTFLPNFPAALARAEQNVGGGTYTTPGSWALVRILRNLRRLRRHTRVG